MSRYSERDIEQNEQVWGEKVSSITRYSERHIEQNDQMKGEISKCQFSN